MRNYKHFVTLIVQCYALYLMLVSACVCAHTQALPMTWSHERTYSGIFLQLLLFSEATKAPIMLFG